MKSNLTSLPTVAVVGRPNVGKSTLFNAMVGRRKSIVSDISGTTRDSVVERVRGDIGQYWLVDTAGLTNAKGTDLEDEIQTQATIALEHADMLLFLVDGRREMTADDLEIVAKLRKSKKPLLFVASKMDDGDETRAYELSRLGLGMPLCVSGKNYFGIWNLQEQLEAMLQKHELFVDTSIVQDRRLKVALVGRPNSGKSTLLNAFAKQERSVVSDIAGTTRDIVDIEYVDDEGDKFLFLDTAGIRRPGKLGRGIEYWSVVRSFQAVEDADVCVLMIDALAGVAHQDMALLGKIIKAGKGLILCINKFDLVYEKSREREESDERELPEVDMWGKDLNQIRKDFMFYLSSKIGFSKWAPVIFISGKTGKNIEEITVSVKNIVKERKKRIPTSEINLFTKEIYYKHVTPFIGTKKGRLKYASQVSIEPPKFLFHVNDIRAFHFSYKRYVENQIREKYGFFGTPIIVEFRDNRDEDRALKRKAGEQVKEAPLNLPPEPEEFDSEPEKKPKKDSGTLW
jgi:GTP-binding protein